MNRRISVFWFRRDLRLDDNAGLYEKLPMLAFMGFNAVGKPFPRAIIKPDLLKKYKAIRDFPAIHGTSHLGIHLRFGTMSIRTLARKAIQ